MATLFSNFFSVVENGRAIIAGCEKCPICVNLISSKKGSSASDSPAESIRYDEDCPLSLSYSRPLEMQAEGNEVGLGMKETTHCHLNHQPRMETMD